jgi:hypothetical protein
MAMWPASCAPLGILERQSGTMGGRDAKQTTTKSGLGPGKPRMIIEGRQDHAGSQRAKTIPAGGSTISSTAMLIRTRPNASRPVAGRAVRTAIGCRRIVVASASGMMVGAEHQTRRRSGQCQQDLLARPCRPQRRWALSP